MQTRPLLFALLVLSGSAAIAQDSSAASAPPLVNSDLPPPPAPPLHVAPEEKKAELAPQHRQRVTFGPLTLALRTFTFEYEYALGNSVSVFVGPRFNPFLFEVGGSTGVRFFPASQPAPRGFWIGPELHLNHQLWSDGDTNNSGVLLAMAGYTFIARSGFTFSVGGGGGLGYAHWDSAPAGFDPSNGVNEWFHRGVFASVAVHANLGWAF